VALAAAGSVIGEPLYDAETIARRVTELGAEIARDYDGKEPLFVGLRNAAKTFLPDLLAAVCIPCSSTVISLTDYLHGEEARLECESPIPISGRHVIVVDDTVDTGLTLHSVMKTLQRRSPASLAVCALLDRRHRRIADIDIKYRGFEAPDVFVVGYGLEYLGRYRELPALYAHGTWPA
jgi:hypoxanthine phosphoribosyltransferase